MKITPKKTLWLFCLSGFVMFAQPSGKIKGSIEFPAPSGPIFISLTTNKHEIVKTAFTEADGSFEFAGLPDGQYLLVIDEIRYSAYQSGIIEISASDGVVILPPILLTESPGNTLEEIVIQKKKPVIENKIDRTVVNVDAMLGAAGGDAMDVLEKSPGIVVDQNGTITFKGKSGVAVFIDDKPTYLSGAELEAYLKSLPASTLNQIELMTNPPAKYDAAGSAGVINIVTKKSKAKGFNGSVSSRTSLGKKAQTRQGLNLNYVNDKFRIFGNVGYGLHQTVTDLYIFRRFRNEDQTVKSYFDQNSLLNSKGNGITARLGMDYYATGKSTFGVNLSGLTRTSDSDSDVESVLRDAASVIDSSIVANNSQSDRFSNGGINLNFRHDIAEGRKITIDADYLNYNNKTNQIFLNSIYQPDNSLSDQDELRGNLPSDIDIYSVKSDYSHALKNGSFETGIKMSLSKTDNVADYRNVVDQAEIPNFDMSNHFKYDEMINAAYVNYNTSYKRFTFQMGLRLENTESKGHQLGNELKPASEFKKSYTNLFPTAYLMYKLDSIGKNQLVTSYSKRINRPYYEDLNPFVSPLDKFTYYSGNPFLNPAFAHNVELSYRYRNYFSTTVSYANSKDDINETIEIDEGIYYSRPGNIGKSEIYSLNVSADIPFATWLSTNLYSEVTHGKYKSRLYTEDLDSSGTFWYVQAMNSFKFSKNWSAELSGSYQTDVVSSQFTLGARGNINVAVQKRIIDGKGSLKLSANDIFYGNIRTGTINNLQLTDATWENRPDSRFVALVFTYSFGKSFQTKEQYDPTGADTEKNRVKGS